jgi:hypothetical protein
MMNDNAIFDENGVETISIFSKKTHFFRFFRLFSKNPKKFSGPFWPQKNEHHNFFRHFLKCRRIYSKEENIFKKK